MVLSMTSKGPKEKDSAGFGNGSDESGPDANCGFSLSEDADFTVPVRSGPVRETDLETQEEDLRYFRRNLFRALKIPDEYIDVSEKLDRSPMEEILIKQAAGFGKSRDAKWCDARGQQGPSPADLGDHDPIPVDTVCISPVVVSDPED